MTPCSVQANSRESRMTPTSAPTPPLNPGGCRRPHRLCGGGRYRRSSGLVLPSRSHLCGGPTARQYLAQRRRYGSGDRYRQQSGGRTVRGEPQPASIRTSFDPDAHFVFSYHGEGDGSIHTFDLTTGTESDPIVADADLGSPFFVCGGDRGVVLGNTYDYAATVISCVNLNDWSLTGGLLSRAIPA